MQNKHWDYEENELEVAGEVDLYIPWNKTKAVGTYVATGWQYCSAEEGEERKEETSMKRQCPHLAVVVGTTDPKLLLLTPGWSNATSSMER